MTVPRAKAVTPEMSPWDVLDFKPLAQVIVIEDPVERRAEALKRLESIQKMAATRSRNAKGRLIYDPDGNTIVKVEEIVQRLLSVEPAKAAAPSTGSALSMFNDAPKLAVVKEAKK